MIGGVPYLRRARSEEPLPDAYSRQARAFEPERGCRWDAFVWYRSLDVTIVRHGRADACGGVPSLVQRVRRAARVEILRLATEDGCPPVVEIDVSAAADGGVATLEVIGPSEPTLNVIAPTGEALGPVPFRAQAIGTVQSSAFLVLEPDDAEPAARPRTLVAIEALAAADVTGTWLLELEGRGTFEIWIADPTEGLEVDLGISADSLYSLRTPATADDLLVVAASVEDAAPRRAPFSSIGPTLDGRPKPDLAAPGENVWGALAAESVLAGPELWGLWTEDGQHILLSGTSQAAPHVSAAAARLLGRRPDLDAAQVRALLVATARAPEGAAWTPELGFGLLDVDSALARLDGSSLEPDRAREEEARRSAREIAGLAPPAVCTAGPPRPTCSATPGVTARPCALLAVPALLAVYRWYRRRPWGRRGTTTSRQRSKAPKCPSGPGRYPWAGRRTGRGAFAASR